MNLSKRFKLKPWIPLKKMTDHYHACISLDEKDTGFPSLVLQSILH